MDEPFDDEEVAAFRADLATGRAPGAYVEAQWSVSPRNRDPAVIGALPERVVLRDTTMRSLPSLSGVFVTRDEQRALLDRLLAAGLPEIVTPNADDVARIEDAGAKALCPSVTTSTAADRAHQAGYDAVQVPVPGFGPASLVYESAVYQHAARGEDWRPHVEERTRADVLDRAVAAVEHARGLGLRAVAQLMMVSYLTPTALTETVERLAAAGTAELTLFDGPGAMAPEALASLVTDVRALAPGVEIGLHPHDTFGLAVACAVAGCRAGATVVETSVNGYCGGPGNADLAAVVMAFEVLYGVGTGVRPQQLTPLARAGEELTGHPVARNQPITGRDAFCWGGGDWVTQEAVVDPLLHNCVEPTLVGNVRRIPLTPQSGVFTMAATLRRLGVTVDAGLVPEVLARLVEEMTRREALLEDDECVRIAHAVQRDRAASPSSPSPGHSVK